MITSAAGDRGHVGFRAATVIVAVVVLLAATGRLVLEAASLGYISRGWLPLMAAVLATALLLREVSPERTWARRTANGLSLATLLLCGLFAFEHLTHVLVPGLDGALALWRSPLDTLPYHGRPAPLSLLVASFIAAGVLSVGWDSTWAVRCSAGAALLSGSYALALLFALAQPGLLRVEEFFHTTAGSTASSALMLFGLGLGLVLSRPHRPPLGPLLTTRMWPLVAVGTIVLVVSLLVSQVAYRLNLESTGNEAAAGRLAFILTTTATIGLLWFTVWYASHQQRRAAEVAQAHAAADTLARVSYRSAVAMAVVDAEGRLQLANPAYEQLLGIELDEILGRRWALLTPSAEGGQADAPDWWTRVLIHEAVSLQRLRLTHADGQPVWVDLTCSPAGRSEDHQDLVLAQLVDVTDVKAAQDELEFRARHDDLTGLLRRGAIADVVDDHRGTDGLIVVVAGLDNFRQINEVYGHRIGDDLLLAVGQRLRAVAPESSHLGRLGGDEFAVVVEVPAGPADGEVRRLLDAMLTAVEQDYQLSGLIVRTSASLGAVMLPRGSDVGGAEVLRSATSALAQAKREGGHRWQAFDSTFHAEARERAEKLSSLRKSLHIPGEIQTWFQPIVDLDSMDTVGYEALVRWVRPGRGVVPAGAWIEAAESDLRTIHQIGLITATDAAAFAARLPTGQRVSLNLSGSHLSSREFSDFADMLRDLNRTHPGRFIIELTETTLANVRGPGRTRLDQLVDAGIGLWADDFGTGYSSVSHLRDLPLTGLKLDKSFTASLTDSEASASRIADGLAGLADGLGLTTIAEGIETPAQARRVAAYGWTLGQGWLFGRPNPPEFYLGAQSAAATEG